MIDRLCFSEYDCHINKGKTRVVQFRPKIVKGYDHHRRGPDAIDRENDCVYLVFEFNKVNKLEDGAEY